MITLGSLRTSAVSPFAAPVANIDAASAVDIFKGAQGIKAPQDTTLLLVVIVLVISLIVIMNLVDSKTGRACMAIRDNYIAAQSVGIDRKSVV